jgi:Ni/Co efflux regulator RcnB
MKRLFAILALCAAMAATAGLGANPAAADGRGDSRQHRQERLSDRDHNRTSWRHHRGNKHHWARKNQRMHYKYRRHHKRHRHALDHRPGQRYGQRHDYRRGQGHGRWSGSAYAFQFDGTRFLFRYH